MFYTYFYICVLLKPILITKAIVYAVDSFISSIFFGV